MRVGLLYILFLIGSNSLHGQNRTITGSIIDESLQTVIGAIITSDSLLLGTTTIEGKFKIEVPVQVGSFIIKSVGFDPKYISVPVNCNYIEIVMMQSSSYDFMSVERVIRLRKRRFKKLPKIHKTAHGKGIFLSKKSCYIQHFRT